MITTMLLIYRRREREKATRREAAAQGRKLDGLGAHINADAPYKHGRAQQHGSLYDWYRVRAMQSVLRYISIKTDRYDERPIYYSGEGTAPLGGHQNLQGSALSSYTSK